MNAHKKIIVVFFLSCSLILKPQDQGLTKEQIDKTAQAIFNPVIPYLTTSLNEQATESLFGSTGFNVGEPLLTYIKKFYFYLEYITHLELAAKLLTLAKENGLTQYNQAVFSWSDLMSSVNQKIGATSWQELLPTLRTAEPDWAELQKALGFSFQYDLKDIFQGTTQPTITFTEIITTSFWKAFPITTTDIVNSDFWQNYLKFTIKGTFQIDESLTNSIAFNQNMVFKYIPKIELAYYTPDFTDLRNQNELLRVSLVLNESYRNRLVSQAVDWSNLTGTNLLKASDDFAQTLFFQVAAAATDTSLAGKSKYSPYTVDAQGNIVFKKQFTLPSPYPEYTTCLAMVMMLQKLTYALFEPKGTNVDPLTNTIKILRTVQNKPTPNFLVYDTQDYLPLEDLTTIIKLTAERKQAAPINVQETVVSEPVTIQAAQGSEQVQITGILDVAKDFVQALEKGADDITATAKDVGNVIVDEGKVLYYSSGIAEAVTGISDAQAEKMSRGAKAAQEKDWTKLKQDVDKVINDAAKIAADDVSLIIGDVLSLVDKTFSALGLPEANLVDDFDTFMDSAANVVADTISAASDVFLTSVEGGIKLSEDGISMVSKVAIDIGRGQVQNIAGDLAEGFFNIVDDTVTTLLEAVTIAYKDIKQFVKDVLNLVASFVKILTNMFIDIATFITDVAASFWCYSPGGILTNAISGQKCDPSQITAETANFLENHKKTISQVVTTGLLIGVTLATGGGALAAGLMAGFQTFAIVGGYQDDEDAINTRTEQTEFLDDYTTYIVNKEQLTLQQQSFVADEYTQKFSAELNNRERGLGLFQNYLNDTLIGIREQIDGYIGSWQSALLTPDANGLIRADVGSLYGYETNFYDLNISQGFSLYSKPRGTIAQEIAESPKHTITNPTGEGEKLSTTKFWFNQRITTDLAQLADPLLVEVTFQTIYLLDNFYVGLYIGGSPLDKTAILTQNEGNLDQAHLAKMLVYTKENKDTPVTLGLYEFETNQPGAQNNWLATGLQGPTFSPGIWYHIKAQLSGTSLQCKVWGDGQPEPGWQTFTVTQCPQQTFGMIFSGAAGEFEVITPQLSFTPNTKIRKPITTKTEKQREIEARKTMDRLMAPQNFATFNPSPMSRNEIIKGHYLYQLTTENQTPDYVTTGEFSDSSIENIGQQPTAATNALVSLVSGKGYQNVDNTLQEKGWAQNIGTVYKNTFTNVSDSVKTTLDTAINTYAQTMMGPSGGFSFGSYNITPTSLEDVQQHQYIYTPVGTGPVLKYNGTPLKNDQGTTLTDNYFVFTLLSNGAPTADYYTGMPYQDITALGQKLNQTVGMISLMTGNIYVATQDDPIGSGAQNIIDTSTLSQKLQTAISTGYTTWENALKKALAPPTPALPLKPKQETTTTKPTSGGSDTSTGGLGLGGFGSNTQTTQESFNERQTDAGGDDLGFGI